MAEAPTMVFLGFGKFVRADKIYALEPIIASRTERSILAEMGVRDSARPQLIDEALTLAERIVEDADRGRVDLGDLTRRARRLLESTTRSGDASQLF
jgi:hypothetical protein